MWLRISFAMLFRHTYVVPFVNGITIQDAKAFCERYQEVFPEILQGAS
jgi:hypothetical protein